MANKSNLSKSRQKKLHGELSMLRARAYHQTKFCLTKDCANTTISNCHVIAEASQLRKISVNNRVSWINPKPANVYFDSQPFFQWRTEGISNVLTFKGFCSECDNRLFINIDKPLTITNSELILLAYRAFAYRIWIHRFEALSNKMGAGHLGNELKDLPPVPD